MRARAALIALVAGVVAAGAVEAVAAGPAPPGRYDGELCVATQPQAAPSCGPAAVEVTARRISVRVADIVYRLALGAEQLGVETLHGRMQIDEFSADYAWEGSTLRFSDAAKDVRYEVRIGARRSGR